MKYKVFLSAIILCASAAYAVSPDKVTVTTDKGVSLPAGVYRVNLADSASFNIAVDLEGIVSTPDPQPDFKDFWQKAIDQLASIPPKYKLTELPEKSGPDRKVYLVEMQSVPDGLTGEPVVIRGYYAEPRTPGPHPVIITYQGYDNRYDSEGKERPLYWPGGTGEWAEFFLSTRGQYISNRGSYVNPYGDYFAYNFGDKDSYYYRGAYMDALRALDFVSSRKKVDPNAIFAQGQSQGGAFTIAAASLDPKKRIRAIAPAVPFMGDFPDYFQIASWPANVAFNCTEQKGLAPEQMYAFLSYFDTKNLAPGVTCPVIQTIGLQDPVCPPHTNMAAYNNFSSTEKHLIVNPIGTHTVADSWYTTYPAFFRQQLEKKSDK